VYEQKGKLDNAIAAYKRSLEINPENPLALNQLAWIYAEQETQLDEALKFAQKASSLSSSPGIIDTLGWVLYKRGEYLDAVKQFELALQKNPFQPTIEYHLGLAYYHNGDRAMAKQKFQEVLELSKDFEHTTEIHQLLKQLNEEA
jgi:tetratricopeptide (TPR) repeat protein